MTRQELCDLLSYDRATGVFTWRISPHGRVPVGLVAGVVDRAGYRRIKIRRRSYAAHRLAWLYCTGEMPAGEIDHINGVRTDNRICNLRDVSSTTNKQNIRKPTSRNTVGFLGVSKDQEMFRATISVGGTKKHIGSYATAEQAHEAYLLAKRELHAGCTV